MNLIDVIEFSKKNCQVPIKCELAYATKFNFMGRIVDGYHPKAKDIAILTPKAARALCQVQDHLLTNHGCGLLVYDAYRPQRSVRDFMKWSKLSPVSEFELERKALHYPHIEKSQLFALGY